MHPQTPTAEVRRLRLQYKRGTISQAQYDAGIAAHIGYAIGMQEALGVDVLVHGEAERTDMVGLDTRPGACSAPLRAIRFSPCRASHHAHQHLHPALCLPPQVEYFGQSLEGMWFSENGWVQVRPALNRPCSCPCPLPVLISYKHAC